MGGVSDAMRFASPILRAGCGGVGGCV